METELTKIFPIECHISGKQVTSNTVDLKSKASLNSELIPKELADLKTLSKVQTFNFPDLRTESQLTFQGLLAEMVTKFEQKGTRIEELRKSVFETRNKLDLERLECEAFQELIQKTRGQIDLIQSKIKAVVLNEEKEDTLGKLIKEVSDEHSRMNILQR